MRTPLPLRRLTLLFVALAAFGANFAGVWNFKATSPEGEDPARLSITQDGDQITGLFRSPRGEYKMEGTVKGNEIRFSVHYTGEGHSMLVPFSGKLEGDRMSGQFKAGEVTGAWSAERVR
jgi:hypothetical protein